ncbi:chlorinating enzyme [Tistlia consotensis]|uniref:Chlorinating enzyme n=1 Tax=Tistlia consotensis USBA 355 TaxID=560819 RepID=A0A1Y6CCI7_9PROT|nr:phytanoyl-CoA dioxygenase family protein [Tistlia consotensis]SMF48280.1 chlorinating enzyme [Tistlia consotensis USBA 355]SNR81445.1 chlorinating enzyme [Tistlia consotensis]
MGGAIDAAALRSAYERDGFYGPVPVMARAEAAAHRARLEAAERERGPMHYRVKPHLVFTSAAEIARHPALLDAVEALLGPDILVWDSSYVIKEPDKRRFVSWHQDLTYWGLDGDRLVTAWVALTDATPENGCMRMLPGSHRAGRRAHHDGRAADNILHRGQTIALGAGEEAAVRDLPLAAGEASLHHGWTLHASNPNRTAGRRIGLTVQYAAPQLRQVVGAWDSATLVRGQDRFGHFAREPVPLSDFDEADLAYQAIVERRKREVYDRA